MKRKVIAIIILLCLLGLVVAGWIVCVSSNFFGYSCLRVASDSMEPSLGQDDLLLLQKVNEDRVQIGDIIAFTDRNGTTIVHRVVNIELLGQRNFVTKGDGNPLADAYLTSGTHLIGKIQYIIPAGAAFFDWINANIVWLSLVLMILVGFLLGSLCCLLGSKITCKKIAQLK